MYAAFRSPGEIFFGAGQRRTIPAQTAQRGSRALIVADAFLRDSPLLAEMCEGLDAAGVVWEIFTDVVPELPTPAIAAATGVARRFRADVFVAVGGGSSIDTAKMAAVLLAHGGDVSDYYGERRVPGPIAPIIAAPTTAGTGSEVTPVAVVTDPMRQSKVGVSSPHLIPAVAVCDPEMTLSCPAVVTAASGADALCHAIESYTAIKGEGRGEEDTRVFMGSSLLTDFLALEAIRRIARGLPRAYRDPGHLPARAETLYGSLLAGLAFGTAGTAAAHALQYPIGALTGTAHGVGVGLLLPFVMEFNRPHREEELAAVALALGAEPASADSLADQAPGLVRRIMRQIGIPGSLAEIRFPQERLEWAAIEGVKAQRLAENNPVPLTVDAAQRILTAAYQGIEAPAVLDPTGGMR